MMWALWAFLLAMPEPSLREDQRPFAEERVLLDRRLETLRRILPDGPTPLADAAVVREVAHQAKLSDAEALARPPLESGARGDVLVDLTGFGRFAEIERLFAQVALHHRLIDVESVELSATPEDTIRLKAVLRLPYRPARAPLPAAPDGTRQRVAGVPRPQADAFVRDQALAVAKSEAIAALRRSRRNPRLFLCELAAIVRDRPVTLSYASLGEEFLVRGLTVGEGPVRALESRWERGFFRVAEFLMRRQGACVRFEARGRSPVAGTDAELPLPSEDPFDQDDAPCRVDRDPGRPVVVKGPAKPGKGPLTVRVRDVDVADVFQILHVLTGQGFVVDGNVAGRVALDLAGVSLEEALATLSKWGLRISEAGAMRRVSMARSSSRSEGSSSRSEGSSSRSEGSRPLPGIAASGTGPTATFLLKRADVRELLAVMTDLDPSLAALGPQGSLGRASLWARDVALGDLRAALLEGSGLAERFEEGRRLLERSPNAEEPLVPVAGESSDRTLVLRPQDLTVLEFELAGLGSTGEGWKAFAYAPTGVLNVYGRGDRLSDGVVRAVESTDLVLDTEEGALRILLAPLPR